MRSDYKVTQPTQKIELEIELKVIETIKEMEKHTGLKDSEIANTALKYFISRHSDFLPQKTKKS